MLPRLIIWKSYLLQPLYLVGISIVLYTYYDISDIYPELNSSKKFLHKCLHNINIDVLEYTAYN